jgi:hypothetical protein
MPALSQYLMIGKLVALLGAVAIICWQSSQIHRWHTHYNSEHQAHQRDIDAYRAAQATAAVQNKAHVQQIETQQQKVTNDVEADYQRKLDAMRRELRDNPKAAAGSANGTASPQVRDTSCITGDTSGVPLSDAERLRAAENELQLDELITWVEQQSQINPNAPERVPSGR